MDKNFKFFIIIPATLLMILAITCFIIIASRPMCIRSHKEICHQKAFTQFISTGKVMIPINHPARDYACDICDEYETR